MHRGLPAVDQGHTDHHRLIAVGHADAVAIEWNLVVCRRQAGAIYALPSNERGSMYVAEEYVLDMREFANEVGKDIAFFQFDAIHIGYADIERRVMHKDPGRALSRGGELFTQPGTAQLRPVGAPGSIRGVLHGSLPLSFARSDRPAARPHPASATRCPFRRPFCLFS